MSGRAPLCGTCCSCGVCDATGNIAFCIRLTGVAAEGGGGSCADCSDLNTTYSDATTTSGAGNMILTECNNCALSEQVLGEFRYPASIRDLRSCYKADFTTFGYQGIEIAVISCPSSIPNARSYFVRAAILKPNQVGMGTDTSELHIMIHRDTGDLVLHGMFEFTSIPFDCQDVDWTAMTIVDSYGGSDPECDWSAAAMEFKFGGDCGNGSPAEDTSCCEDTELPGTLLITTSGTGVDVTDEPLGDSPTGEGFEYGGLTDDMLIFVRCSSGEATAVLNIFDGPTYTIPLTIHSCSPFHATGSNGTVDVEVTE